MGLDLLHQLHYRECGVLLNMVIGVIVDVMTGGAGVEFIDEEKSKDQV